MKFISLNGSTCSGKSTIVKEVLNQRDRLFALSYDSVKRSFSQYTPDTHFDDVHTVMLSMMRVLSEMKYDIICDSGLRKNWRETLLDAARTNGYEVIEINLECGFDALAQRFDERVANPTKGIIINLSKNRFKELHDTFQNEKNTSALTFQTDVQSIQEISRSILKLF